uniref:Peptidase M12B domain-containing protein n=1 Tax=Mola mola TaxID=94237 RepID=A0A3Q3WZG0_MOLML
VKCVLLMSFFLLLPSSLGVSRTTEETNKSVSPRPPPPPVNLQFYRALNIRVALVGLEVWSDMDKCPITQDPFNTLHEFLDWRKVKLLPQKPHDNAQLISGVYFQGTTIGMAPIMSMCTAEQSGGIDHSDNPLGAAVTLAHELGHNFGMNHDTPERGCGCRVTVDRGGCIMTPSTGMIADVSKMSYYLYIWYHFSAC